MWFFKPACRVKIKKALKAVEKEKDQTKLEEIAKNAPNEDVREKAKSILSAMQRQKYTI